MRSGHAAYLPATQGNGFLDDNHDTLPVLVGVASLEAIGGRDPA